MKKLENKRLARSRRHSRIRSRVSGTAERPRLAVFRSNKYISGQLIDDSTGKTLAAARTERKEATRAGEILAKAALAKNIKQVVFDRGGYLYTGRVKALADGARSAGLEF